ncbi:TPA: class III lanthipeptide [Bacillus thuringiensis]|nr:class III lanthipeptide [Bacillus thuringiensis]
MNKVLSLQKIDNVSKKGGIFNSGVSFACAPSSNTSWFLC